MVKLFLDHPYFLFDKLLYHAYNIEFNLDFLSEDRYGQQFEPRYIPTLYWISIKARSLK